MYNETPPFIMWYLAIPLLLAHESAAIRTPRIEMEPQSYVPRAWKRIGAARRDAQLELLFAVKQTNLDMLEDIFHAVSDPRSESYGMHLSNERVHELIAPEADSLKTLHGFLAAHNLTGVNATPNGDMISVTASVEQAEKLLAARYYTHEHSDTTHVATRTESYSLPPEVAKVVDFVAPTTSFPPVNRPKIFTGTSRNGEQLGDGAKKLRSLYSVGDFVGGEAKGNRHAVTGFLEQHFHPADLKEFWTLSMGSVKAKSPQVKQVGDGVTGLKAGVEAELDIEYINALGAGIESEFWGFSGRSPDNKENEPFLKWLQVVSNTSDEEVVCVLRKCHGTYPLGCYAVGPTSMITATSTYMIAITASTTNSWMGETTTTMETAARTNIEFQKAGVRGISLLFASGDSGAGCSDDKFVPNWPAGSPYVTGVGGTTGVPEKAVGLASGGFCNRWPVQPWQKDAVSTYLSSAQDLPDQKYFNKTGRGFPDISAQATNFLVVATLIPTPGVAGTSCASPTASGVIALLNDVRLSQGKTSLGFLNPFIYQNADSFNDITEGRNSGCGKGGFPAAKGWDPVTGVGTPNFEKLKAAVLKLK
eukprot:jgi/Bigna1/91255/estExt_fgenesh1_pg.C_940038